MDVLASRPSLTGAGRLTRFEFVKTVLVLLLLLLCIQSGSAPGAQGCNQTSLMGACSDDCQNEQESDTSDQCGSCACCRVNEPLSPLVLHVPLALPAFPVDAPAEGAVPSFCLADIFRPPRTV